MAEENYTVEKILEHKPKSAKKPADTKQYFIKWEGFGDNENTWEPPKNLNKSMINEYWKSVKDNSDDKITAEDAAKEIVNDDDKVTARNEPEEEDVEEYVVEAITGVVPKSAASHEEAKKYAIKWEGFGDDEQTKEPAAEIQKSAPKCVADFWKAKKAEQEEMKKKEDDEEEEEVKVSKRGRIIRQIKPTEPREPKEPSKKRTKITPSKSQKRPSPSKKESKKTSPASKLKDDDEEINVEVDVFSDLVKRVEGLEYRQDKWVSDRELLEALTKRDDMPNKIIAEILEYLNGKN